MTYNEAVATLNWLLQMNIIDIHEYNRILNQIYILLNK